MILGYYLVACYLAAFVVLVSQHDRMRASLVKAIEEDDNPDLVGVGFVFDKVWMILMMVLFILSPLVPPLLVFAACARVCQSIGWAYHKWKVRRMFNRLKGSLQKMTKGSESPQATKLHETFEQLETALKDKDHM